MKKILLTSGCSFTESPISWATPLSKLLNYDLINYGQASRGNGYISRSVIYGVSELLKTHKPEDILVGVMWSGPNRHEFFTRDTTNTPYDKTSPNPHKFIPNANKNWIGLSHFWHDYSSKTYYGNFYDDIGGFIYTLEHILRLQWFLKSYNINYFMTIFTDIVLPKEDDLKLIDVKHLYDLVDFSKFVDCKSCIDWCIDDSGLDLNEPDILSRYSRHPTEEHHILYAERVLYPFITKLYPCKEGENK